jgi:hypothetical protein
MTDVFRQQQVGIHALAKSKADHVGWAEVCALLDELPDDVVRAHIEELEVALEAWAPQLRAAPPRWAARLQAEGQEPRVGLCRVLGVGGMPGHAARPDDLLRALDAPDVARIDVLGIAYCGFDEGAVPALARRLASIGVRRLDLTDVDIGVGIGHILRLSRDGVLTSLSARSCGLGQGVLEAVVANGAAIGLQEFGLQDNHLNAQDVGHLAKLPGLDGVLRLALGGNKFLAPGVRILFEQAPLHRLRELNLEGTQCGAQGAVALAATPALARLETLSLMSCDIKDAGALALGAATSLVSLRELDLKFNHITATGARALLASTQLTSLVRLNLAYNEIEDDIVEVLASCPQVARFASLTLDDTYLSNEARAALQSLPLPAGVLDLWLLRDDV